MPDAISFRQRDARTASRTPYGQPVEDFILSGMVDAAGEKLGLPARRAAVAAWNADNPVLKSGIALTPVKFGI